MTVTKSVTTVTELKVVLTGFQVRDILREHIYGLMGAQDDRVFNREAFNVDMGGIEFDDITAKLQITERQDD